MTNPLHWYRRWRVAREFRRGLSFGQRGAPAAMNPHANGSPLWAAWEAGRLDGDLCSGGS